MASFAKARDDDPIELRPPLRLDAVIAPDRLVFMASLLEQPTPTSAANKIHDTLQSALARCVCTNTAYIVDVATVMCRAASLAHDPTQRNPKTHQVLPALEKGSIAPAAADESGSLIALHAQFDGDVSMGCEYCHDTLSYLVHTCRRQVLYRRLALPRSGNGLPPACFELPDSEDLRARRARLVSILTKYAAESQFKRTADRYLHLIVRMRVPPWAACKLAPETTPFPLAARVLTHHANDVIRPLIDLDIAQELHRLAAARRSDAENHTALRLVLVAVIIEDLCGGGPNLILNDDLAMVHDKRRSRLCVITEMGCSLDNGWGLVGSDDGPMLAGTDVFDTVLCWLDEPMFAPPGNVGKGLRDLRAAVNGLPVAGGNMVAKYVDEVEGQMPLGAHTETVPIRE
jgi:hypothetical protein